MFVQSPFSACVMKYFTCQYKPQNTDKHQTETMKEHQVGHQKKLFQLPFKVFTDCSCNFLLSFACLCFSGVLTATVVPGHGPEADSDRHRWEGDVRRVEGRHHAAPPLCNFAGQHSDGHDQRHLRWRAYEESTSQVTNTHMDVWICFSIFIYLFF